MCIFFTFTSLGEDSKNIIMSLPDLLRISGKSLGLSLNIYLGGKVLVAVSILRLWAESLGLSLDVETKGGKSRSQSRY